MPFARFLRRSSQPTPVRSGPSGPTDTRSSTSHDPNMPQRGRQASELMATIRRPWKAKRPPSTDPSQLTPTSPLTSKDRGPTTESGVDGLSPPVPAIPGVLPTNVASEPSPEMIPANDPVPDKLADAWDAVKDDPKFANMSREFDTVGVSSVPSFFSMIR